MTSSVNPLKGMIAGVSTTDTPNVTPGGMHKVVGDGPNHQPSGAALCSYVGMPLGGVPYISPNVSVGTTPIQFFSGSVGVPAPVPGVPMTVPPANCQPRPRIIEPVVNTKVKINGHLVGVIGDHSDLASMGGGASIGQSPGRTLTGPTIYPKIKIMTKPPTYLV